MTSSGAERARWVRQNAASRLVRIAGDGHAGRYDFVVVDCQDIHGWGGTDSDWTNDSHVNRANMRRMLRYIVTHSDHALG